MQVFFKKYFEKRLQKQSASVQQAFKDRLSLFLRDPFHLQLHNHSLQGEYKGYRSINITGDIRAVFYEGDEIAVFEDIGSHGELYG